MTAMDAETRSIVAQTLERFVGQCYAPDSRLARLRKPPVDARMHWPLLAELGVPGLLQPTDAGGMGGGARDLADALHVLARGLVLEPVADMLVASCLLAGARSHRDALERAVAGTRIPIVVGLTGGTLRLDQGVDGAFRLRGSAAVVPFAGDADDWFVIARDDAGAIRVLLLDAAGAGTRVDRFALMDGRPAADLHFDVAIGNGLGALFEGPEIVHAVTRTVDLWLTACAADAVGVMDHVIALTSDYLRTRVQFGVTIGTFQALQHRLADMQAGFLESRALLRSWTTALDDAASSDTLARLRRALPRVVARAGQQIGQEAIQMHGGMGVTEELIVSHCNARLQVDATFLQAWMHANAVREST